MITKGKVTAAIALALAALCAMTAVGCLVGCLLGDDIETLEAKAVAGATPKPQTYRVTFNANNGSGTAPRSQTVEPGSTVTLPDGSGLTRTGYFFGGWNTSTNGKGIKYFAGSSFTPTGNVTLYAMWVPPLESITGLANKLAWLQDNAESGGSYTLEVSADESITDHTLSYSDRSNITITLTGVGANRIVRNNYFGSGEYRPLFTVNSGVTLVLDSNITLQKSKGTCVEVNDYGTLIMNTGSAIGRVSVNGGTFTMNGGTVSGYTGGYGYGGGVYVAGGTFMSGTFTMNSGTISDNRASGNGNGSNGGGVYNLGTFTMRGGIISGNTAASPSSSHYYSPSGYYGSGVYVKGTFTMEGGEISRNITTGAVGSGGGVYVDGTFAMSGGTISGNTRGQYGGGVYVRSGTFTMSGGIISGNTASASGGGVYVGERGTFTMSGGEISGNTASYSGSYSGGGGGVYMRDGTFTMSGGEISGNTASKNGGGVYGSSLTMSNGTISGNTASGNGGGVYGSLTMSGGEISGNTASGDGGGVSGSLTMNNGAISGNTAGGDGGGVYVGSGTFTMRSGTISGNTTRKNGGGVWVGAYITFTKTGGTITGYTGDTANGNAVKDSSGAVLNYKGHAVWAGSAETLLKIKEGTAGPRDNMSYDGTKSPPTASGAWDN